ncbi:pimeloyl-ACP methyl ester carboxylesterase [Streptomyces canus]|uniref:alpha/beta fold hydrolase n=1 Tax=Streptomyces canus TaxID=58343 RepID=UPI002787D2DA|nr:alpha/beta hydrolase [Streptomyces canus]MDQ0604510.1 pimeloyl-ACP methyl ester carboxylesterase [Streptomyces canus]
MAATLSVAASFVGLVGLAPQASASASSDGTHCSVVVERVQPGEKFSQVKSRTCGDYGPCDANGYVLSTGTWWRSISSFNAQVIAEREPHLVRKVILAGTGPAGGPGIDKVPALTIQATLKGALTRQDPKLSLFFTETAGGRQAGRAVLERLKERTQNRDKSVSPMSIRAQLKAVKRWGRQAPSDLSKIHQPVLVASGEDDRMVPSRNTLDLAARLPRGELVPLFPDAGHGGVFQYHDEFVAHALDFLAS